MTDVVDQGVLVKETKSRRIKFTIPHPAFRCPKVQKRHYRKWLMLSILVLPLAHFTIPEWEHIAAVMNGLAFYYEPVLEAEADV